MTGPLWQPSADRVAQARLTRFMAEANRRHGLALGDYDAVFDWSVTEIPAFWELVWDFTGIVGERRGPALVDGDRMPGARFFPRSAHQLRREPAQGGPARHGRRHGLLGRG